MKRYLNNELDKVLSFYFPNLESYIFLKKFRDNVVLIELDGRKYVIKEYSSKFTPERLCFFEELQNFTNERMGISPCVVKTLDHNLNVQLNGFSYDLTEFVKNKKFKKDKISDINSFFFDIGFFVGKLHHAFSEIENSSHPTMKSLLYITPDSPNHMLNLIETYKKEGVEESWIQIVRKKIDIVNFYSSDLDSFRKLPKKIVHGDLYLKNILLDNDRKIIGLIDFAQAGTFFRCYEVVRSMVQTNRFFQSVDVDPPHLKNFLKGYLNNCTLDEIELKKMLDLYIYIQASDISFLSIDNINNGGDKIHEYARYRFDSLNSLRKNRPLLNKIINEI